MPENIELYELIVQRVEIKMGRDGACVILVGGMLNGAEIEYFIILRDYNYAAGVLTGGLFDSQTSLNKAVDFRFGFMQTVFFAIVLDVTVNRFILHAGDGPRTEGMPFAEHFFREMMRDRLIVSRKIEVYIGGLIALEAEEDLKGDIVALLFELCTAYGAILIGKIYAAAGMLFELEFGILAVGAEIMRRQRVDFRNAEHSRNERRADGAARTDEIPVAQRLFNKLFRDHIK